MIWLIAYTAGFLITGAVVARRIAWNGRGTFGADNEFYVMAALAGVGAGLVWPASLAVLAASWLLKRDVENHHPREIQRRQNERVYEISMREIARMERELGIGREGPR